MFPAIADLGPARIRVTEAQKRLVKGARFVFQPDQTAKEAVNSAPGRPVFAMWPKGTAPARRVKTSSQFNETGRLTLRDAAGLIR